MMRDLFKFLIFAPWNTGRWFVRMFGRATMVIVAGFVAVTVMSWIFDYSDYQEALRQSPQLPFVLFALKWRAYSIPFLMGKLVHAPANEINEEWDYYGWIFWLMTFFWNLWYHYFVSGFFMSYCFYEVQAWKLSKLKKSMDLKPSKEILGLHLIDCRKLFTVHYAGENHLEVIGGEKHLRNLLPRFLNADCQKERSIILVAPQANRGILEEVTSILRDRPAEELRTFFYYSSRDRALSATYSPFYKGHARLLGNELNLNSESPEYGILSLLMKTLNELNKPYDFRDLELLLTNPKAAAAINQRDLNRDYLWQFQPLWKARMSLLAKLKDFEKKFKLGQYPITAGFPLDVSDILKSGKHIFVELEDLPEPLTHYLLLHLWRAMNEENRPFFYMIFPEKLKDKWFYETYLKGMEDEVYFRVFSTRSTFPYSQRRWNRILFPDFYLKRENKKHDLFWEEIQRYKWGLKEDKSWKAIKKHKTWDAMEPLWQSFKNDVAYAYFSVWALPDTSAFPFYVPAENLGRLEYEPLQRRFKPEDMLGLERIVPKVKYKRPAFDPGVIDVISDLGQRGS